MDQMHTFVRDEPWPSYMANALMKALSRMVDGLVLTQTDDTHVAVVASSAEPAIIAISGLMRWIESTITGTHPGGAAGVYPVYVTAKAQNIVSSPLPYTDSTDYSFALTIKAPGVTPTIVAGTVDAYRQIGTVTWSGSRITQVKQTVPALPPTVGPWQNLSAQNGMTETSARVRLEGDVARLDGVVTNTSGLWTPGLAIAALPIGFPTIANLPEFTTAVTNGKVIPVSISWNGTRYVIFIEGTGNNPTSGQYVAFTGTFPIT